MKRLECILDASRGIYIPQAFAIGCDGWQGIYPAYREILLAGPDHPDYWEAWDSVLSSAFFHDAAGHTWTLCHVDDLFMVRDAHEFRH